MSAHPAPSRARITAGELVVVCSHYDLGAIEEVRRFRGGSRLAPKVLISASTGEYLLKRRAPGPSNAPTKVAFTHEVILHLASRGFPVPQIVGTRKGAPRAGPGGGGDNSMLQLGPASPGGGGIYEVFHFIRGDRYARTADQARAAGNCLARCHALLADFTPLFPAPRRTFHNHPQVPDRLMAISHQLHDPTIRTVCRALADAYVNASDKAERLAPTGPDQIVHGDWHPGNMLFTAQRPSAHRVAAVFDFDAARLGQRLHDLANGAMQFAVLRHMGVSESGEGIPPSSWRIALDPDLFGAFCTGYRAAAAGSPETLTSDSLRAIPWLMIEAMIVEVGVPIASTGKFGKLDAKPVLGVVHRAVEALATEADRLVGLAATPPSR
jgi:hypothetical protein